MNKYFKIVSLAAALCGAVACSSSDNGTSSSTGSPGTSGTVAGGKTTGGSSSGSAGNTSGGNTSGGTTTGAATTGGTTTGAPGPTTFPCVDGGAPYMPTTPPNNLPFCWCNPDKATGPQAYYQIINGCPPSGSTPDLSIPLPPPVGTESIAGLDSAHLPLFVDAGVPGAQ